MRSLCVVRPITLEDGTVEAVRCHGRRHARSQFAVVDCPTHEYQSLISHQTLFHSSSHESAPSSGFTGPIGTVFHFAPAEVLLSESYTTFLSGFQSSTLHVIHNATHCSSVDAMIAGQRNRILLNQLHEHVFPAPCKDSKPSNAQRCKAN